MSELTSEPVVRNIVGGVGEVISASDGGLAVVRIRAWIIHKVHFAKKTSFMVL